MDKKTSDQIRREFVNPRIPGSFTSIQTFFKNRKFKSKKEVARELKKLPAYYLHAPAKKLFKRRKVVSLYPGFLVGADLIQLERYAKSNSNYKYVLIVVDAFTKYMKTAPLKNKSGATLARVFEKMFRKDRPKFLQVN